MSCSWPALVLPYLNKPRSLLANDTRRVSQQWGPYAYDRLTSADVSPSEMLDILRISLQERHMDRSERESLFRAIRENKALELLMLEEPSLLLKIKALKESEWK